MAVRIYIDNKPQGEVAADKDKRWRIVATDPVGLGKHVLRVERLARDGKVEQRLEESFERIVNTASGGGRLNVVVGDNLWNIARAHYGEGWRYTVIFEANKAQIKDPNLIYPGQVFALPKSN
jgi:nucleoid-associated protein YgaU